MEKLNLFDYQQQMKLKFENLTTIGKMSKSIFRAYPVRMRGQKPINYYEIGARNIKNDGEIILLDSDTLRESANTAAYDAQVLVVGDIIIPFRSKSFQVGIYRGSGVPMIPNPSLLVIRGESMLEGVYIAACLRQPFIRGYLEYLAHRTGKLEVDDVATLAIPAIGIDSDNDLNKLYEITKMRHRLEQVVKDINHYEETLQAELLRSTIHYDQNELDSFNILIDEAEEISQLLNDSTPPNESITMLRTDFKDFVDKI